MNMVSLVGTGGKGGGELEQSAGQRAADTKIVWVRWCQTERGLRIPGWGFKLGPMRKSEPE